MSTIFPPGVQLGERYRIVRWIATGSACALFEAEDFLSRRRAALKWLRFEGAKPTAIELALKRAQAAAGVRHAQLAEIYDVVREGGSLFVTSELLRGEPLQAVLAPHLLPLRERLRVLVQAMRGVAAAHESGLVHGGLHPRNIFLACETASAPLAAKVLDVGTSRRHGTSTGARTSGPIGTGHAYLAPEQLCQEELDPRADVYALGVIAYQALTQHLPYEADNLIDMAAKLARGAAPPASSLRPEIPGSLDQVLHAALARDREARPARLEPLIDELEAFSRNGSLQPVAASGPSTALMVRWPRAEARPHAAAARRAQADAPSQLAGRSAPSGSRRRLWAGVALAACLGAVGVAASAASLWTEGAWAAFGGAVRAAASAGSLRSAVASGPPPLPRVPVSPVALDVAPLPEAASPSDGHELHDEPAPERQPSSRDHEVRDNERPGTDRARSARGGRPEPTSTPAVRAERQSVIKRAPVRPRRARAREAEPPVQPVEHAEPPLDDRYHVGRAPRLDEF